MKIALIAEKPSMAAKYRKAINGVYVTNSVGHIETLSDIQKYLNMPEKTYWNEIIRELPFVPQTFKHEITNHKVYKEILSQVQDADEIVLACDPDREGELIHRNILEIAKAQGKIKADKITRIWLHSETTSEIQKAFDARKAYTEYDGYYQAARTREAVDWLIGIQLTMLYSVKYSRPGKPISIGRVQSWLLAEITKRYLHNKNFVPEAYTTLSFKTLEGVVFKHVDSEGKEIRFFIDSVIKLKAMIETCKGKSLHINEIITKPFTEYAPSLYDLKALQKDAAGIYKIAPEETLVIAQSLYEKHHLISYPRTDCSVLSEEEAKIISNSVNLIEKFPEFQEITEKIKSVNPEMNLNKKYIGKLQGHYAIIPVLSYDKDSVPTLSDNEMKIFSLIVKRLAGALMPPARGTNTEIKGNIERLLFVSKFKNYEDLGYKGLLSISKNIDEEEEEETPLSVKYKENDNVFGKLEEKMQETKPQPLFKDTTILSLMENAHLQIENKQLKAALKEASGIGTAATRASFVPLLIKRGYIKKEKENYVPTEIGLELDKILPETLKKPDYSALLEYQLSKMIEGETEYTFEKLTAEAGQLLNFVFSKIQNTASNINMDVKESLGICPQCGKNIIEREKNYSCENKDCKFVLWKTYSGAKLTFAEVKNILKTGKTKKALKMKNKEGKEFEAWLQLDRDSMTLKFLFESKKNTSPNPNPSEKQTLSEKQLYIIEKNAPEEIKKAVRNGNYQKGRAFLDEYFKKQ